jgi:glycosyltransferase involved in cell wall biosynthesis
VLGTIGRLSAEKSFNHLIEAVRILTDEGVNLRAVIMGEGNERGRLEEMISKLHLTDRVLLPGYRAAGWRYMPLFDVFVLPSLTEGLPITILEAMMTAVPIVASSVGGIPELLQNGRYGILVPPGRSDQIADAIRTVIDFPAMAADRAAQARRFASTEYSSQRMAERYLGLYRSVQ